MTRLEKLAELDYIDDPIQEAAISCPGDYIEDAPSFVFHDCEIKEPEYDAIVWRKKGYNREHCLHCWLAEV